MDWSVSKDRIGAATGAVVLEGLIAYALLTGLWIRPDTPVSEAVKLFQITPASKPSPPPRERVSPPRTRAPEGAASPANVRSQATPMVAPPPQLPLQSPIVAAPDPGVGSDPSAGAADVPGPGTGSGGQGRGTGSGRGGYGSGGGGGGGSPPRRVQGRLRDSDYPRWAWEAGIGGTVTVIFAVETDGRVGECEVTRSSGSAPLDEMTCRLIRERFRYRPSLDRQGRPVRSRVLENHSWEVQIEPPQPS